jgi:putative transcriptional regulator
MAIVINLDVELAKKKMSVTDLAAAIDLAVANVSILKNGRAKAVRFTTLDAICSVLNCQPGDILRYVPDDETPTGHSR